MYENVKNWNKRAEKRRLQTKNAKFHDRRYIKFRSKKCRKKLVTWINKSKAERIINRKC